MAINVTDVGNTGGWDPNFKPNCEDGSVNGIKSASFDYIVKSITPDYPEEACEPYLHGNAQIDNLQVNQNETVGGNLDVAGNFSANQITATKVTATTFSGEINPQSWKGFDIKHPNKANHRLRHICLEGPEAGVYFRGRLKDSNIIELPDYWVGLIDIESITVSLTQIGYSQDLIIDKIEWGKRVFVRSGNGANIDCYYTVNASRIDGNKLIVEYEGATPADYPGNSSQFSISGYDYGAKGVDRAD